jgi:hypothetical protein
MRTRNNDDGSSADRRAKLWTFARPKSPTPKSAGIHNHSLNHRAVLCLRPCSSPGRMGSRRNKCWGRHCPKARHSHAVVIGPIVDDTRTRNCRQLARSARAQRLLLVVERQMDSGSIIGRLYHGEMACSTRRQRIRRVPRRITPDIGAGSCDLDRATNFRSWASQKSGY